MGKTSTKKRKEIEDSIESGDVIIITSAGTASLNLQKANTVVFYNVPYSTVNVIQAIGRVTRLGSGYESQNVIFMYCEGTIDEYKIRYFKSNAAMISSLLGQSENLPKNLKEIDVYEQKQLKDELLWQYKKKKNKVRRIRKKAINERLIITEDYPNGNVTTERTVYNLTGEEIILYRKGKYVKSTSKAERDYSEALKGIDSIGFYRSKLRELFKDNDKVMKVYYMLTVEAKEVLVIDNPEYKIGYYLKKYMIENWRILEERLGR